MTVVGPMSYFQHQRLQQASRWVEVLAIACTCARMYSNACNQTCGTRVLMCALVGEVCVFDSLASTDLF